METREDSDWKIVSIKRKKPPVLEVIHQEPPPVAIYKPPDINYNNEKIIEPCWFYNNGGCRHKDGSNKRAEECKYLHLYSDNVRRPPHLCTKKPCDKYNLEGECRWNDNCKYSHRNLTPEEWSKFYPGIPYTLRTNIQKRVQIEQNIGSVESRLNILEFKQDGISRDLQEIGRIVRRLQMRFT
jgi:hypothetical protein